MDFNEKLIAALEADIAANRLILPTLPEIALAVRRTAERPDVSFSEIAAVIARDPGLSARLLKVANSAVMRGNRPIEDIRGAVQRLGLRLVRSLVNSLAIIQSFSFGGEPMRRRLKAISDHSIDVAALSHAIAAESTRLSPDQALLAGLVHDIGKLPLLRRAEGLGPGKPLNRELCVRTHPWLGAKVLEAWKFSPELVAVAAEHEDLMRYSASVDYVDVVIAANLLAYRGSECDPYAAIALQDVPAIRKLGLTDGLTAAHRQRYAAALAMLEVDGPERD
ncbi:MAG: HDOD domain-containing protein [Gammaproteobacteria bacterium]|nr:HDOD domain-containing protein [Gammaproteobacteria bacterium]